MNFKNHSTVELIDHMGDDARILESARISTKREAGDYAADRKLMLHLWSKEHGSPFEMVYFTFKVKMPIFVMRQLVRHRIASINEVSARYTKLPDEFFLPEVWRSQNVSAPGVNKQGSHIDADLNQGLSTDVATVAYTKAWAAYEVLLQMGVAREQARMVLPVGIFTEIVWTLNLRSLANFLHLRSDSHAQPEIQEIATQIEEMIRPLVPIWYEVFVECGKTTA